MATMRSALAPASAYRSVARSGHVRGTGSGPVRVRAGLALEVVAVIGILWGGGHAPPRHCPEGRRPR